MTAEHELGRLVIAAGLAYLVGSINFSIIVARLFKLPDPRALGSGNPGATNLLRTAGAKVAAPILLLDLGRGALVPVLARVAGLGELAAPLALITAAGNVFPVFHRFRGGKGVACAVGGLAGIAPLVMIAGGLVFLVVFAATRRVSLASLTMAASWTPLLLARDAGLATWATAAGLFAVLLATHRENVARLLRGQEPRLALGQREGDSR